MSTTDKRNWCKNLVLSTSYRSAYAPAIRRKLKKSELDEEGRPQASPIANVTKSLVTDINVNLEC